MNKTLIAVAVAATTLACGANADTLAMAQANDSNLGGVALYTKDGNAVNMNGRVEARLNTIDGKANDASRVRLGFGGVSVINDNLYGLGYVQTQYTSDDNNTSPASQTTGKMDSNSTTTTRLLYAGLGGKFGQVVYGKTDGSMGQVTDFTDIMWSFGGNVSNKLNSSDRPSNDVAYSGAFGDFAVKANYKFADANSTTSSTDVTDDSADGYSTSVVYNVGATGVKLGAGYENQNKSHKYTAAAGYTIGNFYVGGLYTDGDLNFDSAQYFDAVNSSANPYGFTGVQEYKAYELAASYTMGKTSFTTTYNKAKTDSSDTANLLGVETAYAFTSNFRTYLGYQWSLLDQSDTANGKATTKANASDQAMLGLRYDF